MIDPILKFPKILSTSITPNVFDTSFVNAVAVAVVTSEEPISDVSVTVRSPATLQTIVFALRDDGVLPDTTPGDGRYTGLISFSMTSCRVVGDYQCNFIARNVSGLYSPTDQKYFKVINSQNQPPLCSNLSVQPDSAKLLDTTILVFKINVIDPNGSCDIRDVYYDGTNPSGQSITRRYLFDDGNCCPIPPENVTSGDSIAGDGIYTRVLRGPPTELGYYRYHLKAVDRSDSSSNILSDSIYVHP